MKINEFTTNLNTYVATVRVVLRNGTTMAKTLVICDGVNQARMLLMRLYGEGNVFSVHALMDGEVTEGTKTVTASELQVMSLTDRAKQLNQQAKETKARQSLEKAQKKFRRTALRITNWLTNWGTIKKIHLCQFGQLEKITYRQPTRELMKDIELKNKAIIWLKEKSTEYKTRPQKFTPT